MARSSIIDRIFLGSMAAAGVCLLVTPFVFIAMLIAQFT